MYFASTRVIAMKFSGCLRFCECPRAGRGGRLIGFRRVRASPPKWSNLDVVTISTTEKESTMNPSDPADKGLVTLSSAHNTTETVNRLKALLAEKAIELFAHI